MTLGPSVFHGTLESAGAAETATFSTSTSTGPVSLTLSNWTFASTVETVVSVPVAVCQAG